MISLLAAFQFLSITPAIVKRAFTPTELGRSVGWYPLVGAAVGGVLLAANWGLAQIGLGPLTTAAILIALWLLLTRALHLDGWMDAWDGLFGGWTPERRLEIMRDSRVGAFGVAAGIAVLLIQAGALSESARLWPALLIAPVLGRWAMSLVLVIYPYGRASGLGRAMKDHARWPQAVLATVIAGAVVWFGAGRTGLLALALGGIAALLAAEFARRRIGGGLTGDLYGAICVLVETGVLVLFAAGING